MMELNREQIIKARQHQLIALKALGTDISIVRVSRGSGKTAHLREVGRIKADVIRADTVRKMQERLKELYIDENITDDMNVAIGVIKQNIDDIAKEMLEEINDI